MGKYGYTDYGECEIITDTNGIATLNPFRYRGYFYEKNSGLYYLKTRFYNPITGRFISIDDVAYVDFDRINGISLYAYCNNNPIMNVDPEGTWSLINGIKGIFNKIKKSIDGFVDLSSKKKFCANELGIFDFEFGAIKKRKYGDDSKLFSLYTKKH